uniref:Peptidase A1 domain-containing protein n=1 Tax=Kalanchoe fedtschenkoi TaxID=63787 RepID=A0A7N0UYM9_KALFE
MATYTASCCFLDTILIFSILTAFSAAENSSGFTANLYQRDTFYNPNLSQTQIIRRAIARSIWRANISSSITPNSPTADIIRHTNLFWMKIRLGTPPVDILVVADTGSDLTWTQCLPCTRCFSQHQPLFNTQASSSYGTIQCGPSRPCPPWNDVGCLNGLCHQDIKYVDETYTRGLLSTETLRMDSTVQIPNSIFGCGMDNMAHFGGIGSGVIGLGDGPESIVTQLGHLSGRKFSYCLMPLDPPGRVSTSILETKQLSADPGPSRRTRIPFIGRSGALEQGNIMIDSGTALTSLPRHFYAQIKQAVRMQTHAPEVPDPDRLFELCFREDRSLQLSSIMANFRGGNVPLKGFNAFVTSGPVTCLAFEVSESFIAYGSLAQQDFLVGFDQNARTVPFKPFECSHA